MVAMWRQIYKELNGFVMGHPEIKIGENTISIPRKVKSEFYHLFDKMRTTFVEENFPNELREAECLSKKYTEVKTELIKMLELDCIYTLADLDRFLQDPRDQLARELFDLTFNLLRRKVSIEAFTRRALQCINESLPNLLRSGYQKWVELSLVRLLNPKRVFRIPLRQPAPTEIMKYLPTHKEPVPSPEETRCLSLDRTMVPILIVPDFIVYSAEIHRYVAFKSKLGPALWFAAGYADKREWILLSSIEERVYPKPDIVIYVDESPEDISLIADAERICRPDLVIMFMERDDLLEARADKATLYHQILKPKQGTFVVSRNPIPKKMFKRLKGDICLLEVGFEQNRLDCVVRRLVK